MRIFLWRLFLPKGNTTRRNFQLLNYTIPAPDNNDISIGYEATAFIYINILMLVHGVTDLKFQKSL